MATTASEPTRVTAPSVAPVGRAPSLRARCSMVSPVAAGRRRSAMRKRARRRVPSPSRGSVSVARAMRRVSASSSSPSRVWLASCHLRASKRPAGFTPRGESRPPSKETKSSAASTSPALESVKRTGTTRVSPPLTVVSGREMVKPCVAAVPGVGTSRTEKSAALSPVSVPAASRERLWPAGVVGAGVPSPELWVPASPYCRASTTCCPFSSCTASGPFCHSTLPARSRTAASPGSALLVATTRIPSAGIEAPSRLTVR